MKAVNVLHARTDISAYLCKLAQRGDTFFIHKTDGDNSNADVVERMFIDAHNAGKQRIG